MEIKQYQISWTETGNLKSPLEETPAHPLTQNSQPYFRSKAFVSQISINPLIASASPLFFLVEKAQRMDFVSDILRLREDLIHEIKAFENQAQSHDYRPHYILAARYVICLWIDEMILNTSWGKQHEWNKQPLITNIPSESSEEKSFFLILNHCLQDIPNYADLLELQYLCLSLGFEGEYRYLERGHLLLAQIRDNLFHSIQRFRGEISNQLEITTPEYKPQEKNHLPLFLRLGILCSALLTVLTCYFVMHNSLQHNLKSTNALIQSWSTSFVKENP
jgi:type IV/VI secretion system ImpK/VasF family protein